MSEYLPPNNIEPISIFNPANFETLTDYITIDYANKHYLKYPIAQGLENLLAINVNGNATFNYPVDIKSTSTIENDMTFKGTGDIIQESGSQILQQPASTGYLATDNVINGTTIRTDYGQSTNTTLRLYDISGSKGISFLSNASNNAYDNIVNAGDAVITSTNSTPLVLTNSDGNATNGIRLDNNQALIGFGGSTDTPSTSVICNGTNVLVSPSLKYPDNSIQSNAYTGAGNLTGSYTNTNMTVDSNGKITALSNGSSVIPADLTENSLTISATNKYAGGNCGIFNYFNTGAVFDFTGSGTTQVSVYIDSWTQTTISASNAVFDVVFNFWNGTNFGTTNCKIMLFPNRWVAPWNANSIYNINNKINGDASFNYSNGTYSPSGRQYWTYDQSFSGISGANAYLNGSLGYCIIRFQIPDTSYSYAGTISCLNTKAVQGQNRCFQIHT